MKGDLEDMGMLKSISLENYKCFKEKTDIEIAPLTVLCGINSSGKSSILKSLLMLKQSYESENSTQAISFNGKWVDNGFFNDVIYHDDTIADENKDNYSCFYISNSFDINPINKKAKSAESISFRELRKIFYRFSKINSFKLGIKIHVRRPSTDNQNEFSQYIDDNIVECYSIKIQAYDYNNNEVEGTDCEIILKNISDTDKEYELLWSNIPCSKNPSSKVDKPYRCTCYFSGLQVTNIYRDNMADEIRYVLPSLLSIFKIAALQYEGFHFIAPLRKMPERNYFIKKNVDSVGIAGEDTPYLLAKLKEEPLDTDMSALWNNDFPCNFQNVRSTYDKIFSQWTNHFGLGNLEITGTGGNVSIGISGHNISDIGFGVSQILPIITQGIIMQKNQTLLIEQPEIHLHPKMQMDMADFLLQLACTNRNVIVETHSDHIINRLVRRIMEDSSGKLNKIICIYFVDKDTTEQIKKIVISPTKGIIDAPLNFFSQFATETMDIAKIGFNNHRKGIEWGWNE